MSIHNQNEVHPYLKITRLPSHYTYYYHMHDDDGWRDMESAVVCDGILLVLDRRNGMYGALNAYGKEIISCRYDYLNYKERYLWRCPYMYQMPSGKYLGNCDTAYNNCLKVGIYDKDKADEMGKNLEELRRNRREEDFVTKKYTDTDEDRDIRDTLRSFGIRDFDGGTILPCVYDHIEDGCHLNIIEECTIGYWMGYKDHKWQAFFQDGKKLLDESFYHKAELVEAVDDSFYKAELEYGREYDHFRLEICHLTQYRGSEHYYFVVGKAGKWGAVEINGDALVSFAFSDKEEAKEAAVQLLRSRYRPTDQNNSILSSPCDRDLKMIPFTELNGTILNVHQNEYRNADGKIVIDYNMGFTWLYPIGKRLFRAQIRNAHKHTKGLIDEFGNIVLPVTFARDIFTTNTGRIVVVPENESEWFFFDEAARTLELPRKGHIVEKWRNLDDYYLVTERYEHRLQDFPSDVFSIVDGDGNTVLPFEYDSFFACCGASGFTCKKEGVWYHMEFADDRTRSTYGRAI